MANTPVDNVLDRLDRALEPIGREKLSIQQANELVDYFVKMVSSYIEPGVIPYVYFADRSRPVETKQGGTNEQNSSHQPTHNRPSITRDCRAVAEMLKSRACEEDIPKG
jgi:hypothetical protein